MLLKNKTFYQRHLNEIIKITNNDIEILHLVNTNSNIIINQNNITSYHIDSSKELSTQIKNLDKKFDLIIVTDLIEVSQDLYIFFKGINALCKQDGKILISSINPKWNLILRIFELVGLKQYSKKRSYIHPNKIGGFGNSVGLELINFYTRQFLPFKIFGLGTIINLILEIILFKFNFGLKTYFIFRKLDFVNNKFTKTIIIPAKNEEKNLISLIDEIPEIENLNEIIISYANSEDKTEQVVKKLSKNNKLVKNIKQSGKGKGNAVFDAIDISTGDLIAILDADKSVDPKTLPTFFKIVEDGHADFINGTRLVYDMESGSMRYINKLGNRIFQFIISIILNVNLSDSLCGTKVFKKKYIKNIYFWKNEVRFKDPFCDFDLLFSSAYSGQKILEYAIHYKSRTYGTTQISRFRDGFKLIIYILYSFILFNTSRDS